MRVKNRSIFSTGIFIFVGAFLVCVMAGVMCPMMVSAADAPHQSSSPNPLGHESGNCPEQLANSMESSQDVTVLLGVAATIGSQDAVLPVNPSSRSDILQTVPTPTSYPLRFVLFSVFLN